MKAAQNYQVFLAILWRSQPQTHLHYYFVFNPNLMSRKTISVLNAYSALLGQDRGKAFLPQR